MKKSIKTAIAAFAAAAAGINIYIASVENTSLNIFFSEIDAFGQEEMNNLGNNCYWLDSTGGYVGIQGSYGGYYGCNGAEDSSCSFNMRDIQGRYVHVSGKGHYESGYREGYRY